MAETEEFLDLLRDWRTAVVVLATFGFTLLIDLSMGIIAGCLLAVLFAVFRRPVAVNSRS
jgi:SulP family sulfate permease